MASGKTYVVWEGRHPGIYETWEDCRAEIEGYPGARYKGFSSQSEAIMAYREKEDEAAKLLRSVASHLKEDAAPSYPPEVIADSLAVDAGCMGNPGIMEYRGVYLLTGQQVFKVGPYDDGTNNIGEFLAIVHGLALLKKKGSAIPIYSDSKVALKWVATGKCNTKIAPTPRNAALLDLVRRAEAWLAANAYSNPLIKWETSKWGEIPADFGRK